MYIRTNEGLGQATNYGAMNNGLCSRTSRGLGQVVVQKFGPTAVQNGLPFGLTDEQLKVVLGALRHAPGAETFFYIHTDSSGSENTFKFGDVRAAPAGVPHQSGFQWDAAMEEADRLTRKARATAGSPAVSYKPAGFGHTHPEGNAGEPSGTDLGNLASIPTPTPMVAMVVGTALTPRPAAVGKRSPSGKRRELEASVIWRSAYAPAPGGKLLKPRLTLPGLATYASHQAAANAAHNISPDLVFRYFGGRIVYENGQFSSEFREVL